MMSGEYMEVKQLNLGMVNAYLIKDGNEFFLIDTGMPMSALKLEKALELEGVQPADISMVIITHSDIDHIGNCAYLREKYGLKIAVHEDDIVQCLEGTRNMNRKRKASLPSKVFMSILSLLVIQPLLKKYPLKPFEPDVILSDGQDLNSYGLNASVVHIPGHTKGSIGILTGYGDFFVGDTLINRRKPAVANIVENEAALLASVQIIKNLSILMIYPGHGKPFNDNGLKQLTMDN